MREGARLGQAMEGGFTGRLRRGQAKARIKSREQSKEAAGKEVIDEPF